MEVYIYWWRWPRRSPRLRRNAVELCGRSPVLTQLPRPLETSVSTLLHGDPSTSDQIISVEVTKTSLTAT